MLQNIFDYFKGDKNKVTISDSNKSGGDLLVIDATTAEDHNRSSQATQHEIEDGTDIADHIIKKGITLNISGIISDDPINLLSTLVGTGAGIVGSLIGSRAGAIATGVIGKIGNSILNNAQGKPSKSANEVFEMIYEEKVLCTIITGLKTYTNMVLENYSAPRSSKTTRSLEFTAQFRQITIANSESVSIPKENKEAGGVADSDSPTKNLGKKATTEHTGKGSSLLYKMVY